MLNTTEDNSIVGVPVQALLLDPRNPRLIGGDDERELTQPECAQMLLDRHDPLPIARSLAAFGFFPSDPLIGYPDGDNVVVVEGNRRLLAVRLLIDEGLRNSLRVDDEWDLLAETVRQSGKQFQAIPTELVLDREAAAPVIGFRHIVGIKRWGAWEKAAFVRDLLRQQRGPDDAFEVVATLTGEKPSRIRRYLRDYLVVRQAELAGIAVDGAKKEFGVFTRALSSASVNRYMGTFGSGAVTTDSTQAYAGEDERVRNVIEFLFGDGQDGGLQPVLSDARKISELGKVLADEAATHNLLRTRNLEESLAMTGAIRDRAMSQLGRAFAAVSRAETDLREIDVDEPIRDALTQIRDLADAILAENRIRAAEIASTQLVRPGTIEEEDYDLDLQDDDSADE